MLLAESSQRLVAVASLDDPVAVPLQGVREEGLDRILVVDEENGRGRVRHLCVGAPTGGPARPLL